MTVLIPEDASSSADSSSRQNPQESQIPQESQNPQEPQDSLASQDQLVPQDPSASQDPLAKFYPTKADEVLLGKIIGLELIPNGDPEIEEALKLYANLDPDTYFKSDESRAAAQALADASITKTPTELSDLYVEHVSEILSLAEIDARLCQIVLIALGKGVQAQDGFCACSLGGIYYMNSLDKNTGLLNDEPDYENAKLLYEAAGDWDCYQGMVNLGYIYEYGRTDTPDYAKAMQCYSLAAALSPSAEALYKYGDCYSRGKACKPNKKCAMKLWLRAYDLARESGNWRDRAQAAIRIAPHFLSSSAESVGLTINPLFALHLYQEAEYGLRLAISNGESYYQKRLQEAIDGQDNARMMLDLRLEN